MATFAIPAPQLGASPAPMSKASMRTTFVKMADAAPSPGKECKRGSYTLGLPRFTYPRLARVADAPSDIGLGALYNARRRRGGNGESRARQEKKWYENDRHSAVEMRAPLHRRH